LWVDLCQKKRKASPDDCSWPITTYVGWKYTAESEAEDENKGDVDHRMFFTFK
jgi:hypothetical protein